MDSDVEDVAGLTCINYSISFLSFKESKLKEISCVWNAAAGLFYCILKFIYYIYGY